MRNKEGLVDDLITSIPGEWKFDEQVSQHFDTHVRKSVPLYEEVQKAVIEISEWFIRDNSVVYDLGSSTGETISLLLQKHSRKKNVRFIGVEESLPMIEIARKKCSSELVQFLQQHIEEINDPWKKRRWNKSGCRLFYHGKKRKQPQSCFCRRRTGNPHTGI